MRERRVLSISVVVVSLRDPRRPQQHLTFPNPASATQQQDGPGHTVVIATALNPKP